MVFFQRQNFRLTLGLILCAFCILNALDGQQKNLSGIKKVISKKIGFRQDTSVLKMERNSSAEVPDTNFTFEKYAAFLAKVSDTSKYIVLPINDFRQTKNSKKIVIGLRHDVDNDLNVAYTFSETESKLGFRSTYYILHTAPYYLENKYIMSVHSERILPILKSMQDDRHFEIGWHNDLVTLQAVYSMDPVLFLHNELKWLRSNGINIYGSASHGSNYCYTYFYLNYYFFEECTYPAVGQFVNNTSLPINGTAVPMKKGKFSDFDLKYEAYFLDNNKYFSDASITNGVRWNIGMLDINKLVPGDRVILLLHPIHWHKASTDANIETFKINGQKSSVIYPLNSTITVELPYGMDYKLLAAAFTLSPGAYSKVSGKMQVSATSVNDYSNQVIFTVYAENRDVRKDWIIDVHYAKNSVCSFESFIIPGLTKYVNINSAQKTILIEINEGTNLLNLPVQFEVSPGARVFIGSEEQFSNVGSINFSGTVKYLIKAEDGISSSLWTVTIVQATTGTENSESSQTGLSVYPNPSDGLISMKFMNIQTSPTKIDIFNALGETVYSNSINKTGSFIVKADLSRQPQGVFYIKYLNSEKPFKVVIQKNR